MTAPTFDTQDPHRSHPDHPVTDDDSAEILENAIYQLGIARSPMGYGDAGLRLHAIASLIDQAQTLLPDAVADARDQNLPWSEIADQLHITESATRRRYSRHARTRTVPIDPD